MRILEKGEDKVYIKRCSNCNSLIEFERTDVTYDPLHTRYEARYEAYCPVCRMRILLSPSDLLLRNSQSSIQIAEECLQDTKS